jgi:hypothetical protein
MPRNPKDRRRRATKARPDSDTESVDSKGNVRNLIDYDYEESEELF